MNEDTYIRNSDGVEVEAIQFDGTKKSAAKIMARRGVSEYLVIQDAFATGIVYSLPNQECREELFKGSWLVKWPNGDWSIVLDIEKDFHRPESPERAKLKAQVKALDDSIIHWMENLSLLEKINVDSNTCACCALSPEGKAPVCSLCPIFQKTKQTGCVNTPWRKAADCLSNASLAFDDEIQFLCGIRYELQTRLDDSAVFANLLKRFTETIRKIEAKKSEKDT